MPKDYYQILQVHFLAEQEVIEAAYKRLARKYHPDANKSSDATFKMQQINEAYEILKSSVKRKQYDKERSSSHSNSSTEERNKQEAKEKEKHAKEDEERAKQRAEQERQRKEQEKRERITRETAEKQERQRKEQSERERIAREKAREQEETKKRLAEEKIRQKKKIFIASGVAVASFVFVGFLFLFFIFLYFLNEKYLSTKTQDYSNQSTLKNTNRTGSSNTIQTRDYNGSDSSAFLVTIVEARKKVGSFNQTSAKELVAKDYFPKASGAAQAEYSNGSKYVYLTVGKFSSLSAAKENFKDQIKGIKGGGGKVTYEDTSADGTISAIYNNKGYFFAEYCNTNNFCNRLHSDNQAALKSFLEDYAK